MRLKWSAQDSQPGWQEWVSSLWWNRWWKTWWRWCRTGSASPPCPQCPLEFYRHHCACKYKEHVRYVYGKRGLKFLVFLKCACLQSVYYSKVNIVRFVTFDWTWQWLHLDSNYKYGMCAFCYSLCQTCVQLPCLIYIEPTDVLLHDSMEEQLADAFNLTPSCQGPEGHLQVGRH